MENLLVFRPNVNLMMRYKKADLEFYEDLQVVEMLLSCKTFMWFCLKMKENTDIIIILSF